MSILEFSILENSRSRSSRHAAEAISVTSSSTIEHSCSELLIAITFPCDNNHGVHLTATVRHRQRSQTSTPCIPDHGFPTLPAIRTPIQQQAITATRPIRKERECLPQRIQAVLEAAVPVCCSAEPGGPRQSDATTNLWRFVTPSLHQSRIRSLTLSVSRCHLRRYSPCNQSHLQS